MGQARRVPWASKGELYELYDWLFSPVSDEASRKRGLARMNVYISSPSCPAFMFLLHNLLSVALLPPPSTAVEAQAVRLMCGMAIVRFINGLVDPLQTGPYARPISHIAASLNIPPHLIGLRHRATHEDLPDLPVLQAAVAECINYLHHYSFLPLLAESSTMAPLSYAQMSGRRGEELVRGWKKAMKQRLRERDVRDDSETGREVVRIKRKMERMASRGEIGEVVEALCGVEGLVATAKTKRSSPNATSPPEASIMIWQPLIAFLGELNPNILAQFATRLLDVLLYPKEHDAKDQSSASFRWTTATWLMWLWNADSGIHLQDSVKQGLWKGLALALMGDDQILRKLAKCLSTEDETIAASYETLMTVLPPAQNGVEVHLDEQDASTNAELGDGDVDAQLQKLEDRMLRWENALASRRQFPPSTGATTVPTDNTQMEVDGEDQEVVIPGWKRLGSSEWSPRPVGIFA